MKPLLTSLLIFLPAAIANGAPGFVPHQAEQSGIGFGHSFEEDHPMAYLYHGGFACAGISVGDVNGDELPDLYFADGPGSNALYINRGGLEFEISKQKELDGGDRWATGTTLIDIDADGDLDLFQVNYDSPIQFFRNDGKGNFTESPTAFGLEVTDASLMLSFADVDRDGDLDAFLLCHEYFQAGGRPNEIPVVTKNGQPTIKDEFSKYFHLKKDSKGSWQIDNYGRRDYLFLNEGTRTEPRFRDVSQASGVHQMGHGLSCLWLDFDHDGDLDLYVANDFSTPDRLFRNDGLKDGLPRFTDVASFLLPATTWSSMGSDLSDIDNNGLPDLLVADMSATTHFKSKVNMGEMKGDNREILETGWPRQAMRNHLFRHNGSPMFSESAWASGIASTDWTWAPKFGDFDQDGYPDLFISNGMTRNFTDSDHGVKIGDISKARIGKTMWDLYKVLEPMREANLAFRNLDGNHFEKAGKDWGLDLVGLSYNAACGDLDRDGDLDLVVSDLGKPSKIYENQLADGNSVIVALKGITHDIAGIGAKVMVTDSTGQSRTRWMLPASGFQSQNEPTLHFGLGKATPASVSVVWQEGSSPQIVKLEPDRKRILIEEKASDAPAPALPKPWFVESSRKHGIKRLHKERLYNDFYRQPLLPAKLSQIGPAFASCDVDADGDLDLFVGGGAFQQPELMINTVGQFQALRPSPFSERDLKREDIDALWFDADGDKDLDLYIVSGSTEVEPGDEILRDRLMINRSSGRSIKLEEADADALPALTDSGSCVTAADYDGDGDLDLFVGTRSLIGEYPLSPPSRLLRNESTRDKPHFVEATSEDAPGLLSAGLVTDAEWSDIDLDGDSDLLLAVEWGPIRIFLNEKGKLTEQTTEAGLAKRTGWWTSIHATDIDGDGDDDLLLGNTGTNTKYKNPSKKKPSILYYGDMDGSGKMRLVEAKNSEDRLLPVRGRSCSSGAIPSLAKKFPSYRDYALSDLTGVYSEKCLSEAKRFEAVCLKSGVLINRTKKGETPKFEWVVMPWEAQLSQINDFAVADLDGKEGLEIVCAQNNFTREAETGLWRGNPGCVLRWNGKEFESISPRITGIVLPFEARKLIAEDFNRDGRPDVAAAQNNAPLFLFTRP